MKFIKNIKYVTVAILFLLITLVAGYFIGSLHGSLFSSSTKRSYGPTVIKQIKNSDKLEILTVSNYKITTINHPDKVFGITINGLISGSSMKIFAPSKTSIDLDLSSLDTKKSNLDNKGTLKLVFSRALEYNTKLNLKKLEILSSNEGIITSIISKFGDQAKVLTKQNAEYQRIENRINLSVKKDPKVKSRAVKSAEIDLRSLFKINFDKVKHVKVVFE